MMWLGNDITMCFAEKCPIKEQCHRYTCKPDRFQSYSDFSFLIKEDNKCEYYWPMEKEEDR